MIERTKSQILAAPEEALHYKMQVKIQLSGITFHPAGNLMLRQNNFKCG